MNPPDRSIKDKLYYLLVEKNSLICGEYSAYVNARLEEHNSQRWRHWLVLLRLNWHYRVRRASTPLLIKRPGPAGQPTAPYLGGPESAKGNRQDPYHFAAGLMKYDVISFDIFDTLILRKLDNPEDLFMIVGEKLDVYGFYGIRKKCESEVRQQKRAVHQNNEVTLDEIYERVSYYTGVDSSKGANTEFSVELDMCFANPYMYEVFQILKNAGKRIYATSNMYLPKEKMELLLSKNGYTGFEDILVSCDYHCGKGNGALFRILQSKLKKDDSIIHIGDNLNADIKGAQTAGIETRYYMACRDLGNPHRSAGMSPLIGSAYRGIINTRLHNGTEVFSEFWEYGYVYGGIIVLGFVHWIHKQAKQNGISKILFLARDGFIIKKVYDALFQDIPSEYVYWSRISALRNVCEAEREPFLTRLIGERCNKGDTILDALKVGGIEALACELENSGLSPDMPLMEENKMILYDFLVSHWDRIKELLSIPHENTLSYMKGLLKAQDKIAIVDVGWSGRNLGPLVKTVRQIGIKSSNLSVYMIGNIGKHQNTTQTLLEKLQCYMFDACYNREIHDRFCKQSVSGLEAIEKIFSAPHSSSLNFDRNENLDFAPPEIDNYSAFNEIEAGILEFCQDYHSAFSVYPYMENIRGYDSYIPVRLLFNHPDSLFKAIGNLTYTNGVSLKDRRKLNSLMEKK